MLVSRFATHVSVVLLCSLYGFQAIADESLFDQNDSEVIAEEVFYSDEVAIQAVRERWMVNFFFENDLFSRTDQQYTNGIRVAWVSPDIDSFIEDESLPLWMRNANRFLSPLDPVAHDHAGEVSRRMIFSLGQKMFTPDDRERTTIDPNDRPYAGWLYLGMGYHTRSLDRLNSFEVNLGVVGPAALAQEAQDFVHDVRGFERFNGWDNQLSNELGVQFVYEHKHRVFRNVIIPGWQHDFIVHGGGSLGNVATYLNTGGQYRIGHNLPGDFGTSALRPGGDNSVPMPSNGNGSSTPFGFHGFVSLDGRLVMHHIFLDGNTFRDSHSVEKRHLTGDLSIGFATHFDRWKISYANVWRSRQFRTQNGTHSYGSLGISYSL